MSEIKIGSITIKLKGKNTLSVSVDGANHSWDVCPKKERLSSGKIYLGVKNKFLFGSALVVDANVLANSIRENFSLSILGHDMMMFVNKYSK